MELPKFTAELSLNDRSGQYNSDHASLSEDKEHVIPAASYWGDFRREGCVFGRGDMKYSAILWGIPWGKSWRGECFRTPAYIRNVVGEVHKVYAKECINQGLNEWGVFWVPEPNCSQ